MSWKTTSRRQTAGLPTLTGPAAKTAQTKAGTASAPVTIDQAGVAKTTGHETVLQARTDSGGVRNPSAVLAVRSKDANVPTGKRTMRFGKHNGPDVTFPLSRADATALANCDAVSPFTASNPRVLIHPDIMEPPTHPGDKGFWPELEKVLDIQTARQNGGTVEQLLGDRTPKLFEGYSLEQAADAVHTDLPTDWPTALLKQFLGEGAKFDSSCRPAPQPGRLREHDRHHDGRAQHGHDRGLAVGVRVQVARGPRPPRGGRVRGRAG